MPELLGSLDLKNRKQVTPYYFRAVSDPELEVSVMALDVLKNVAGLIDQDDIIEKLMPEV